MAATNNKNKNKLANKIRVSIFNDTTHEKLFSFKSNGILAIVTIIVFVTIIAGSTAALISFTPLREFIPGYPSAQSRRAIIQNAIKIDSLQKEVNLWRLQLTNIQRIVTGKEPLRVDSLLNIARSQDSLIKESKIMAKNDSLLRNTVIKEEQFNLSAEKHKIEQIEGLHFFPPVRGMVTQEYNAAINHPYIDIAAPENSVVSSVLDGTVIMADYSELNGYVIQIQHSNDLISIYKHNAKLLKKVGDTVSAGSPISLVGNTGKLSTASHLHFELWHKGKPINPAQYIKF